ncbi:SDR family NAD(P)-dependent oxidoreductase [Rhodococcus sp. ACS1]|uniref:SDR family NAD(P)-dependent oxidoreductase n=1 Tax=Rhodococcus sp. ACS1 TaxID=2028570 RepID=UPI0015CB669D|nr:SDR family oxidoreductase [Rhodococcus sp. ACS1]
MDGRGERTAGAAVVTGAAGGIGQAIAHQLAKQGHHVLVADIDAEGGASVVDSIVTGGGTATFVRVDMGEPSEISELMASAADLEGGLRVLVNGAAATRAIDLFDVTVEDWNQMLQLDARGTFLALQSAARHMRDGGQGGSIVNIASIGGKGWKETSNIAYASSKGAIVVMTRVAANRLGRHGIRVNSVCPGMTRTAMMEGWLQGRAAREGRDIDDLLRELAQGVPLLRINTPEDIAAIVGFLASEAARTITGQSVNVDGGLMWD